MIIVLCANLSVDRTFQITTLNRGRHHRPIRSVVSAGGKGVNAARVLRRLGYDVVVTGFAGGQTGQQACDLLQGEGVRTDFVRIAEESRLCVNIVDDETHRDTQIDEIGPLVTPGELQALRKRFRQYLRHAKVAVIAGSAPRGVPFELLGETIVMAHEFDVPVFLDARDRYLAEALPKLPDVVKPNYDELSSWAGERLAAPQGVVQACQRLLGTGIKQVVVSLGEQGAIGLNLSDEVWWATPPQVPYVSAVGSGDSMLAGLIHAYLESQPLSEQLRWAVAAGTANVSHLGAAFCGLSDIASLLQQVMLKNLNQTGAG